MACQRMLSLKMMSLYLLTTLTGNEVSLPLFFICKLDPTLSGARCNFLVRAFAHGAMGRRIDPSWWTHWAILVPASAPRLL